MALGDELAGSFASGWTLVSANWAVFDNYAVWLNTLAEASIMTYPATLTAGKTYQVSFEIYEGAGFAWAVYCPSTTAGQGISGSSNGVASGEYVPSETQEVIQLSAQGAQGSTAKVRNLSVREVLAEGSGLDLDFSAKDVWEF